MKTKSQIALQFKNHKSTSQRYLSAQYDNTMRCQAFYAGDIMNYQDKVQFYDTRGQRRQAMVQFNKIKPYVNSVKGFMAQNRRKASYIARIQTDGVQQAYSKYANALSSFLNEEANSDQYETQQDGDLLICGYGATETALTYGVGMSTTDPNGQLQIGRLDPLKVGWDPFSAQPNMLDARWAFYEDIYNLDDAMDLYNAYQEDFEPADGLGNDKDSGFQFMPNGGRYDKVKITGNVDWSDQANNMCRVYFYQWFDYETFYRADNPIISTLKNPQSLAAAQAQLDAIQQELEDSGKNDDLFSFNARAEILTFDGTTKAKLESIFGEYIKPYEFKRKVFYTAVLSGMHVFTAFKSICQQGFSIKFKTGDYDSKNKIWTGMVNSMMQPQLYYNKALTETMFIIGANSKGGVMYEKGSISNIADFESKYAKTDTSVEVSENALMEGRIKPKKEPYSPTGYEGILAEANTSINDVNGIDKTFLGSSENKNETGILQKRRIRQVVSALACYFDSLTLYKKEQARLLLDLMRVYAENNDGSLFRVLGQNGKSEFIKISADKLAPQYDVVVEEAPQTPEDKEEFASTLVAIADKLKSSGDPAANSVYAMAIKYTTLDAEDKLELMQILKPEQKQVDPAYVQQLEQQLSAVMGEISQADIKEKLSRADMNIAKVEEIKATVAEKEQKALQTGLENKLALEEPGRVKISI